MEELKQILLTHYSCYPKMGMEDAVKLIYQNEFGCGHFVTDESTSLVRLTEEVSKITAKLPKESLFEEIGNGFSRLNLGALVEGLPLTTVNRFFVNTSRLNLGTKEGFEAKLQLLGELCAQGLLPFDQVDLGSYLQEYEAQGYPPVSHSKVYRGEYNPSYWVVSSQYAHYFPLFWEIEKLLKSQDHVVVAIDGPSGSGKSTLSKLLQGVYHCPVIKMDHFFLRPEQRTSQRFQEPGGNVDYERFQGEAGAGLKRGLPFSYQIYNCQINRLTKSPPIEAHPLRVVEGSYSLHPALRDNYDLRVFLTISPEEQRERILKRNGPQMLERFLGEWIPLEEQYFSSCQIQEHSDLVFREYKHFPIGNS